jgi:hypothetical protein
MEQELLCYQLTEGGREGWLARIAELVAITNQDPALGGAGAPDPAAGPRALGARNGKAAPAKRAASRAASSPRREPSCQIVQRTPEVARISLKHHRENHDRTIDYIGDACKNVKVPGELIYNLGCLALTLQQCYVVWPDKFRPDVGARYDRISNPIEFLQLYIIAIQAACGD